MSAGNFARYARCYDLLYRDKDYAAEARFVHDLLGAAGSRPPGPLLDLGCGTGVHARAMAALGWRVTGVDLSEDMIALARARTPAGTAVDYATGAAAEVALGRRFAVVVSLFHVASYQAAPGELARMVANAARHLEPGGVLVFDFWHGPGVRAEPPEIRRREVEDAAIHVSRLATPTHFADEQIIEVKYDLVVTPKNAAPAPERFAETHRLRYYFLPEVAAAVTAAGLTLEQTRAGLSDQPLGDRSWYGLVVARKPS